MSSSNWQQRCSELLSQRKDHAQFRQRQAVEPIDATHVRIGGREYVNFASNNYLGLTHHPRIRAAIESALATAGSGSGAAGLITGHTELHARAESALATWKGTEASVLLPSGYQANLAAVQTLAAIGESYPHRVRFLVDKLAHASLIDAVRATGAPMRVFPHNGLKKLQRLLEDCDASQQLQVVLTESIFSMDGDAADLKGIAQLKQSYPFLLLLDEAHGSGVYGPQGSGLAAEMSLQNIVDVSIITLSKALGISGGAVCGSAILRDALLNFGRAYIYTTNTAPMIAGAVEAAIAVMREEPQRQQRVRELARRVRSALSDANFSILSGDSPIIPVVLGSEDVTLDASRALKDQGLLVPAVRPPTVPPRSSRLRVTVCCEHTDKEIGRLVKSVSDLTR